MATNTTYYNLIKPDLTDNVDIDDINDNMDIIDSALNTLATTTPTGGGFTSSLLLMGA